VTTSPVIEGKDIRRCRSCDALIVFARTGRGKAMPLDAEPRPDGNVELLEERGERRQLECRSVLPGMFVPDERRHVAHFATCPLADQHRAET
jgi:hypothetical protein